MALDDTKGPKTAVMAETSREFLVATLGESHEEHTIVSKQENSKSIGFCCSCDASIEYYLAEPIGKRAVIALRNVPPEGK